MTISQSRPIKKINPQNAKRPSLAFLSANIHIGVSRVLWPGVLDAARDQDANLICFPGGRLYATDKSEAMRNIIFQQAVTEDIDGFIIWNSALAGNANQQEVADFHLRYQAKPIVDLASSTGFGPLVTIDSHQGMRALLFHLIEEHNYQRIALIRGPESHPYAAERHQAFLETLKEKGIPIDERLISPDLGWNKGAEAMAILLDDRGVMPGHDFQAVVAASDLQADPVRNQAILDRIPAGRWGDPTDLQGAAVFLASAASDYVHGSILAVDGGWLAR